jgi:hypothetical protein
MNEKWRIGSGPIKCGWQGSVGIGLSTLSPVLWDCFYDEIIPVSLPLAECQLVGTTG